MCFGGTLPQLEPKPSSGTARRKSVEANALPMGIALAFKSGSGLSFPIDEQINQADRFSREVKPCLAT